MSFLYTASIFTSRSISRPKNHTNEWTRRENVHVVTSVAYIGFLFSYMLYLYC